LASDLKDGDQPNYQDSVTLSASRSEDENAVAYEDDVDPIPFKDPALLSPFEKVKYSCISLDSCDHIESCLCIFKLRKIVRSIRSSPQHRQQWFEEISMPHRDTTTTLKDIPKMLILDVRTRWSSAHQMCSMSQLFPSYIGINNLIHSRTCS
jgi:hypothetical protein